MSATPAAPCADIFSVDVEDYFHVEAFSGVIPRREWDRYPCRVEANTRRLLDLLDEHGITATFFVLGWVAERCPGLVREIVARGHEPACHSYWHRLVHAIGPREFRADTLRAKDAVEQAAGVAIEGYRAPSFSITARSPWAFEILAAAGFRYDSSVFPIRHDVYGVPDAPRAPFRIATPSGPLIEYPLTTFRLLGRANLPLGGGGYLRILPFWYTRLGVTRIRRERLPLITYVHPWEVDADQPRLAAPLRSRLRHYTNLAKTTARLRALMRMCAFTSVRASQTSFDDMEETPWPLS